jgi:hypothetical protein
MKITVECKVGQAITVSIDDENLVNHIGFVEEKPIEQETCKWKRAREYVENPHDSEEWCADMCVFCYTCGKPIEVVE